MSELSLRERPADLNVSADQMTAPGGMLGSVSPTTSESGGFLPFVARAITCVGNPGLVDVETTLGFRDTLYVAPGGYVTGLFVKIHAAGTTATDIKVQG